MAVCARRVVVTGLGVIAAPPLNQRLNGERSPAPEPPPEITAFEVPEGAPAWGFEALDFSLEKELPQLKSFVDRTSALAMAAASRALKDAQLADSGARSSEVGCAFGTMLGCLEAMTIFWNKVKTSNPKFAQPLPFTQGYANSPSSLICIEQGLRGPAATFSGDALAGLQALLFAYDQIASGAGEIILAGASESLTLPVFNHLYASQALSRSGSWADGTIPGEGAAMLVLESEESARRRKVPILAVVEAVALGTVAALPLADDSERWVCSGASSASLKDWPGAAPGVLLNQWAGDCMSVTPVLAAAVSVGTVAGRYAGFLAPGQVTSPRRALALGAEGHGQAGWVAFQRLN